MKKKIFPIILIIIGIGLISFGAITFTKENKIKNAPKKLEGYKLEETKTIESCMTDDCQGKIVDKYIKLSYDYDSKVLQNAINKLNKNTETYYNKSLKSTSNSNECSPQVQTRNKHRYRFDNSYNVYSDGKIITLNINRIRIDLCNNNAEFLEPENYVYDIKKDKIINLEETLKILNLTNEDLIKAIKKENDMHNEYEEPKVETKESYPNLKIYYDTVGSLYVNFYSDELQKYVSAKIEK